MANTRDLMNKVLRGLRQFGLIIGSGTSSTTDDYLLMILQIVNEAKEEVEESGWAWEALRNTVTLTVSASTIEYDLTSAGPADVDTNERTRLLYESVNHGGKMEGFYNGSASMPQVFETSTSSEYRLREISQEKMERWHATDDNQTGKPTHIAFYRDADSLKCKIYPTPDAAYTIVMRLFIPQAELTSTDLTTTLSIPSRPVWMRALYKANEERGSELGRPGSSLHTAMLDAHAAASGSEMSPADSTVNLER
jgi:hypothetical protein